MGDSILSGYATVREVSKKLKVSEGRVRQLLVELKDENGNLPGTLVGQTRFLSPQEVQEVERLYGEKRPYTHSA